MLPFPNQTIYHGLSAVTDDRPDAPALVFEDDTWSYADVLDESRELAGGLADLGVEAGDTVAVWLSNRPAWVTTTLAASALGAAVVAVNTRYRADELAYMLDDAGCRVLVTESTFLGTNHLERLAEIVPSVRTAAPDTFDPEGFDLEAVVAVDGDDLTGYDAVRRYDDVRRRGDSSVEAIDDAETPAAVFYTSGTTGDPKGCLQPSRSLLNHSANALEHLGVESSDTVLGTLPFPGIWGFNVWLGTLARGATLVVQSHFTPEETARLVDAHDVTCFPGLATMFTRTFDAEGDGWTASLERGAVGFLTLSYEEALFERIEDKLGFPLVQPYGLSEANSMIFVGRPDAPLSVRKRVGGPLVSEAIEAKIVDPDTGERRPEGEKGELWLRGYNVMVGYLGAPEKTAEAVDDDGWLRTGDVCSRDGERLEFHSRLDDALRVRGFLVSPREIEQAIDAVAGVSQSQVVGVDHDRHGQIPVAFVRRDDHDLDARALHDALAERIADYKLPERIEFVESFPRSEGPHGAKIQKHELRERARTLDV